VEDQVIQQIETPPAEAAPTDADAVLATAVAHPATATFPALLAAYRTERGWSKADLAKRAAFDPSTITRLSHRRRSSGRCPRPAARPA
jgi:ribosome-binding protein aMBF1 (putative translation factor)